MDQLGGIHILGHSGMCRSNGSLFHKKSLNMVPFSKKIFLNMSKHGSVFFKNFRVFAMQAPIFFLNGPIF